LKINLIGLYQFWKTPESSGFFLKSLEISEIDGSGYLRARFLIKSIK
jgi:hypothetical protein